MKARIKFKKYGALRFIGHLDVMRFFQKAIRRAHIPIAYTGGYSPHMIMSFANPLGIGITSEGEYFDIELKESISSAEAVSRLNAVMVEGIEVLSFRQIAEEKKMTGMAIVAAADYLLDLVPGTLPGDWETQMDGFSSPDPHLKTDKTQRKRSGHQTFDLPDGSAGSQALYAARCRKCGEFKTGACHGSILPVFRCRCHTVKICTVPSGNVC